MGQRWTLGLVLSSLIACSDGDERYLQAQEALRQTMSKTGDLSYEHPEFDAVEKLFRAVPTDADEYQVAQELAARIRTARQRFEVRRQERAKQSQKLKTREAQAEAEARERYGTAQSRATRERTRATAASDTAEDETDSAKTPPKGARRLDKVLNLRRERIRRVDRKTQKRKKNYEESLQQSDQQ